MVMIVPGLIAGGAALAGQWLANRANKGEARRNRAFQERMRNTEWQAAVEDMRKAGLNPALAYSQGGASSPSGSMYQAESVTGKGTSSALQGILLKKQIAQMDAQIAKTQAETKSVDWDAAIKELRAVAYQTFTEKGASQYRAGQSNGLIERELMASLNLSEANARKLAQQVSMNQPLLDMLKDPLGGDKSEMMIRSLLALILRK